MSNKRSVTIARHRTSVSLEDEFWTALTEFAAQDDTSVSGLIAEIDKGRGSRAGERATLSSAIRLYVLKRARKSPSSR